MKEKHKFGVWKEQCPHYVDCPSVYEFVNPEVNAAYPMEKLLRYLNAAGIVCATSGTNFRHAFTGERFDGAYCIRTDGVWEWPEDLVLYIEIHGVVIPDEWYHYIQSVDFVIPEKIKLLQTEVDWE